MACGLANADLTAPCSNPGEAAARLTIQDARPGHKPKAIIGRAYPSRETDHALAAGLASAGMDVVRVGVVTTPTVAHLTVYPQLTAS